MQLRNFIISGVVAVLGIEASVAQTNLLIEDRQTCERLNIDAVKQACLSAVKSLFNGAGVSVMETSDVQGIAELGIEHLQRHNPKDQKLSDQKLESKVREVLENRRGLRSFVLENGQVWKQNEADYIQIPKKGEFFVVIRKGRFGDYQLRIDGMGRMTRVKRQR